MARMAVTERRAALIQAALRVIAADGVAAATTRAITAEAGMSLASFHYAFRSRDELIAELIPYVVEHESLAAEQTLAVGHDLRETIQRGLQGFLDLVAADPAREQAMFELSLYALRTEELHEAAKAQYASYYKAAEGIVEAAAQLTGRTWSRPASEIAQIVVTLTDGLTLGWLVHRDRAATQPILDFAADAIAALADPLDTSEPA
ncbi:AcrR family transcriptional regulator [Hamadaea flava]|uniref:TetR/AcrR family transcriptional regulator n=1 Tax=Hamadaea flava TaxID=1742688 RepID=A0ABV8LPN0_9ACTN|nr:TetR family transcriptional regulator [Hamadaea flava]MCP2322463.1 AcrR family transcriptional regulator [Hamadaea flava]